MESIKLIFALAISTIILNGCCNGCGEPAFNHIEYRRDLVSHEWTVDYVQRDGKTAPPSEWDGFVLTFFQSYDYTTVNSANQEVWPSSGVWRVGETETLPLGTFGLIRGDLVEIVIWEVDETSMMLRFTIGNDQGFQDAGGDWQFNLKR